MAIKNVLTVHYDAEHSSDSHLISRLHRPLLMLTFRYVHALPKLEIISNGHDAVVCNINCKFFYRESHQQNARLLILMAEEFAPIDMR